MATASATATKQQKGPMDVRIEHYKTNLKVVLTPAEIADRADRAAQIIADADSKEEERKAADKHAKAVIESLESDHRRLSNEVRTRSTYRMVDCERRYDFQKARVFDVRIDTGEVVNDRAMTEPEKQRELNFEEDMKGRRNGDDAEDE